MTSLTVPPTGLRLDRSREPKCSSSGSTEKNRTQAGADRTCSCFNRETLGHQDSIAESFFILSKYAAEFENTCSHEFLSMSTL